MKVRQGQSFLDMILQTTGSIDTAIDMAVLNSRSITASLKVGDDVQPTNIRSQKVVNFFTPKNKIPATAWTGIEASKPKLEGISYWELKNEFIVS